MAAISDLAILLATMRPMLGVDRFVFCTLPEIDGALFELLSPVAVVREGEGVTVVVEVETARHHGLSIIQPMRQITLSVYSDLEAVGLTAAFARVLADVGVSANVVAGYHHDHIFVPDRQADAAMDALLAFQAEAQG